MRNRKIVVPILLLGLGLLTACDKKEETVVKPAAEPAVVSVAVPRGDRDFALKAASSGLAEVEASRSISDKTTSESIRQFAQMMITDHGAANDELMAIAQKKQLDLPTVPNAEHQQALSNLKAAMGIESDRMYVQDFGVKAHEDAVALFQREAQEGTDSDLKAFAAKTLPTLKTHLEHAQRTAAELPK